MTHVFFFKLNQTSRRKTKKHFSIFAKTLKPFLQLNQTEGSTAICN